MSEELLPCPFCGGEAILNHLSTIYADAYVVTCCGENSGNCPALAMDGFDEDREEAIKALNTRPDSKPYQWASFHEWWVCLPYMMQKLMQGAYIAKVIFNAARERKEG